MPILSMPVANLKPRLATHSRPHTLEVGHLLLAAPDEATSSGWLRSLVRAASGVSSSPSLWVDSCLILNLDIFEFGRKSKIY